MNVEVQMRHFLIGAFAGRVPDRDTVARESSIDRARHSRDHDADRRRELGTSRTNVRDVLARDDEHVSGVKLPKIEKRDRLAIRRDDRGWESASRDLTEGA